MAIKLKDMKTIKINAQIVIILKRQNNYDFNDHSDHDRFQVFKVNVKIITKFMTFEAKTKHNKNFFLTKDKWHINSREI